MKKVVIFSTDDIGGAGKAAHRLMSAIDKAGHVCKMAVKNKETNDERVVKINATYNPSIKERLIKKYRNNKLKNIKLDNKYYYFGYKYDNVSCYDINKHVNFNPDIIIVTWISWFVSPGVIKEYASQYKAKIILYPMDMSLFTGGCHYAWSCQGYMNNCDNCPAILNENLKFIAKEQLGIKKYFWEGDDIEFWACSTQVEKELRNSILAKKSSIKNIFIPIDENIFNVNNKELARNIFNINENDVVILFGSKVSNENRKGLNFLIEALNILNDKKIYNNIKIIIAGIKNEQVEQYNIPFEVIDIDFIKDDRLLSLLYQSSDVLVSPSIQDSGPMMINEAQMCGLPVVSFSVGVAIDFLVNNKTGFLSSQFTSGNLAEGIEYYIVNKSKVDKNYISTCASEKTSFFAFSKLLEKIW